jgi:ferric iron reductase protein FhuF
MHNFTYEEVKMHAEAMDDVVSLFACDDPDIKSLVRDILLALRTKNVNIINNMEHNIDILLESSKSDGDHYSNDNKNEDEDRVLTERIFSLFMSSSIRVIDNMLSLV